MPACKSVSTSCSLVGCPIWVREFPQNHFILSNCLESTPLFHSDILTPMSKLHLDNCKGKDGLSPWVWRLHALWPLAPHFCTKFTVLLPWKPFRKHFDENSYCLSREHWPCHTSRFFLGPGGLSWISNCHLIFIVNALLVIPMLTSSEELKSILVIQICMHFWVPFPSIWDPGLPVVMF